MIHELCNAYFIKSEKSSNGRKVILSFFDDYKIEFINSYHQQEQVKGLLWKPQA